MTENNGQDIVLPDDERAAKPIQMTGWLSRDGCFYGDDEWIARWAGATHVKCADCGEPTPKGYVICLACREKKAVAKFAAREVREWDGHQMIYSEATQDFYSDPDDALDAIAGDMAPEDARFLLCEPVYVRQLDGEVFSDDLPDDSDGELPDQLADAIDAFNAAVKGLVLSWRPGKFALKLAVQP